MMASEPAKTAGEPAQRPEDETAEVDEEQEKFSPEEEANLLAESNNTKKEANSLFTSSKYEAALSKYEEAVAVCPNYLDYELAVLRSNLAACHLKLSQWKEAISSATSAIDGLNLVEKEDAKKAEEATATEDPKDTGNEAQQSQAGTKAKAAAREEESDVEEEIVSAGAGKAAPAPEPEPDADSNGEGEGEATKKARAEEEARKTRREDVLRIRAKALMRRARARSEDGGWSNLAGAEEDYKLLATMTNLAPADMRVVRAQLRDLPPRVKAAQEKETAEMWGKLKDLGNGILNPFGLSTDNFQMVKDEATGGYSMNFTQGGGGK